MLLLPQPFRTGLFLFLLVAYFLVLLRLIVFKGSPDFIISHIRNFPSLHKGWAALPAPKFPNYYPFTDGPDEANRLLEGTSAQWRPLAEM